MQEPTQGSASALRGDAGLLPAVKLLARRERKPEQCNRVLRLRLLAKWWDSAHEALEMFRVTHRLAFQQTQESRHPVVIGGQLRNH